MSYRYCDDPALHGGGGLCHSDFGRHEIDCRAGQLEHAERIIKLQTGRGMSARAATIVVDAAMYGIGCIEGMVREQQQRQIDLQIDRERKHGQA